MMMHKFVLCCFLFAFACTSNTKDHLYQKVSAYSVQSPSNFKTIPHPKGVKLTQDWELMSSDLRGGLTVTIPAFSNSERVNLPHRLNVPGTAIWYRKQLNVNGGVLVLNADDGAQVFVNGERIPSYYKEMFKLPQSNEALDIVIRVMNQALRGGLRDAEWWSEEDFLVWEKSHDSRDREWKSFIQERVYDQPIENEIPLLLTDPVFLMIEGKMHVRWVTDTPGLAQVNYGATEKVLSNKKEIRSFDGIFEVIIDPPIDTIHFEIQQMGLKTKMYSFTPQISEDTLTFTIWGDSQGGWDVFKSLITVMNEYQPKFSIGAGDLVGYGSEKEGYPNLLQSLSRGDFYHYPIIGNHDYDGYYDDFIPQNYLDFVLKDTLSTYFSWKEKEVAFIAMDPHIQFPAGLPENSDQVEWLRDKLESNFWKEATWRFIVLHHPPYSQGWPDYHGEKAVEEFLNPYLERGLVDVVVAAHSHNYERLLKNYNEHQTAFVVSGGGGGGLEPIENSPWPEMDIVVNQHHFGVFNIIEDSLQFEAYNLDNELIDSFSIIKN